MAAALLVPRVYRVRPSCPALPGVLRVVPVARGGHIAQKLHLHARSNLFEHGLSAARHEHIRFDSAPISGAVSADHVGKFTSNEGIDRSESGSRGGAASW